MDFKIDLHNHTSDFPKILGKRESAENYAQELITKILRKRGNLVLGISDFNRDKRYERFLSALKKLDYTLDLKYEDFFFSLSQGRKKVYFIRTNEIETDRGHILLIGFLGNGSKTLKELLQQARKQKAIVIATHPLHEFPLSHFLILRALGRKQTSISMDQETIRKNVFDGLEYNPYFPGDWKNIRFWGLKKKTSLITNSDAHFLNEFFRSYVVVDNLDFKTPRLFKKSLRKALKKHLHIHAQKAGYVSLYKHGIQIVIETLFRKLGIMKD